MLVQLRMNRDPEFLAVKLSRLHDRYLHPLTALIERWKAEGPQRPSGPAVAAESFNIVGPASVPFDLGAVSAEQPGVPVSNYQVPMTLAFELSTGNAAEVLGFSPQHPFAQSLADAVTAGSDGPDWYRPAQASPPGAGHGR
jgi:hypothetical protein